MFQQNMCVKMLLLFTAALLLALCCARLFAQGASGASITAVDLHTELPKLLLY